MNKGEFKIGFKMISVVIPAFNEEGFLPQCLESLKNQDYKGEHEIIVVDNAAMIAACGYYRFQAGKIDSLDLDVVPSLKLA